MVSGRVKFTAHPLEFACPHEAAKVVAGEAQTFKIAGSNDGLCIGDPDEALHARFHIVTVSTSIHFRISS
jgi:hypothetical protein